jgi:hypothetical protein
MTDVTVFPIPVTLNVLCISNLQQVTYIGLVQPKNTQCLIKTGKVNQGAAERLTKYVVTLFRYLIRQKLASKLEATNLLLQND